MMDGSCWKWNDPRMQSTKWRETDSGTIVWTPGSHQSKTLAVSVTWGKHFHPLSFCFCVSLFKLDFSPLSLKESWFIQGFILFPPAFCWLTLTIDIHSQELCQGRTVCACKWWRHLSVPPNRPRYMSRAWEAETLGREHKILKKMSFFFFPWLCLQSSSPQNPCLFSKENNFCRVPRYQEIGGGEGKGNSAEALRSHLCSSFLPNYKESAGIFFYFLFDAEL